MTEPNQNRALDWFTPLRFGLLLALLVFAAFPQVLLGLETFVARDYGFFVYPLAHFQRDCFWHGELPLWNPYNNCGVPFLAQWNTMPLYPPSLIYLLLPLQWSLGFFCLLHLWFAGFGMFFLARRWTGLRRAEVSSVFDGCNAWPVSTQLSGKEATATQAGNSFAAAFAGVAFAFNGLTLNLLMWPSHIATLSWMPWVVLAVELAWREGGQKIILAAFIGALQMLAGGPEIIFLTWILLLALWVQQFVRGESPRIAMLRRFPLVVARRRAKNHSGRVHRRAANARRRPGNYFSHVDFVAGTVGPTIRSRRITAHRNAPAFSIGRGTGNFAGGGATAAVPRSRRPFAAERRIRGYALVHARLGLGEFSRADGFRPHLDRRSVLPIRTVMDVVLLSRHRRAMAGIAGSLDGTRTPRAAAQRGGTRRANFCVWRKHVHLPRPAQNHPATQLDDISNQIRDLRGVFRTAAGGIRTGAIILPLLHQRRRGPGRGGRNFSISNPVTSAFARLRRDQPALSPLGRGEGEDFFPAVFSIFQTFSNWSDFVRAPRGHSFLGMAVSVS